jgi:hypothetical protein
MLIAGYSIGYNLRSREPLSNQTEPVNAITTGIVLLSLGLYNHSGKQSSF